MDLMTSITSRMLCVLGRYLHHLDFVVGETEGGPLETVARVVKQSQSGKENLYIGGTFATSILTSTSP